MRLKPRGTPCIPRQMVLVAMATTAIIKQNMSHGGAFDPMVRGRKVLAVFGRWNIMTLDPELIVCVTGLSFL